MGELSPIILLDSIRKERDRRNAEKSLIEFTKQAWHVIEPGIEFVDNWHLHAIAEHLEAMSNDEIQNLIINIPPGCMKSILVSVAWPAWEWIADPTLRYLGASYGEDLAIRDAQKSRDIITSEWFLSSWNVVNIKRGQDDKRKYALEEGGWRIATSVGGRATGEHPDRKIVDDPHNAKQADSTAERLSALVWYDRTLSSRGVSRKAKTVVVMQRLHASDMSGHILAQQLGYDHVCIPMEYDGKKKATSIGWFDPRKKLGELLWPEMFPSKTVNTLKIQLGEYGTAGQLQQQPSPLGGGIIKTSHFQKWPHDKPIPALDYVLQSYDTAFTKETTGDPTACTVWGLFNMEGQRCCILIDAWAEHLGYPELRRRVMDDWRVIYNHDAEHMLKGRRPDQILIEKKGSGISLIQDLHSANIPAYGYDPSRADKVARAHQATPILEMDVVYIPESKKTPGHFVSWARPMVEQMELFPNDDHDDLTDTWSQAMIFLRDNNLLELPYNEELPPEDEDYSAKRNKRNPYAA